MAERLPKPKDLRGLSSGELTAQLEKLRQELWGHRVKAKEGALTQTHHLRFLRRQIARVHTVLRAQQLTVPSSNR